MLLAYVEIFCLYAALIISRVCGVHKTFGEVGVDSYFLAGTSFENNQRVFLAWWQQQQQQ